MSVEITSISSSIGWHALSSYYPHDEYISLQPTLVKYLDGYHVFNHPLYEYTKDVAFQKQSNFTLTSAMPFFTFADETTYAFAYLGSYVTFEKFNGFIAQSRSDNRLYLSAVSNDEYTFFRLINNTDGTVSFMRGDSRYVTVCSVLPYDLYMDDLYGPSEQDRQRFNVYSPDDSRIYITTKFANPYYPDFSPQYIERFWSFSDDTSALRAIGIISDDDWGYDNPYIFDVTGYDILYTINGLERDQTWVMYYNSILDKDHNRNVEVQYAVSGIPLNRLVDNPYLTQINLTNKSMAVNIANLKTVMTPEYEYDFKTEQQGTEISSSSSSTSSSSSSNSSSSSSSSNSSSSSSNSSSSSSSSQVMIPASALMFDFQFALSGSYDHSNSNLIPATTGSPPIEILDIDNVYGGYFTGNEYLTFDESTLSSPITGNAPRTMGAWFVSIQNITDQYIGHQGSATVNSAWTLSHNSLVGDRPRWEGGALGATITGDEAFYKWTFLAACYDGTNQFMYRDGVLVNSGINASLDTTEDDIIIGARFALDTEFIGIIKEVFLTNYCFTSTDVYDFYKGTSGFYIQPDDLLLDFQFALSGSYDHSPYTWSPTVSSGTIVVESIAGAVGGRFTNQYIEFSNEDLYKTPYKRPKTFMAWLFSTSSSNSRTACYIGGTTGNSGWGIGKDSVSDWIANVLSATTVAGNSNINRWQHVAVTFDTETWEAKIYVNGQLKDTLVLSGLNTSQTGSVRIGTDASSFTSRRWIGHINDVKLWSATKSPNYIESYYQTTSSIYLSAEELASSSSSSSFSSSSNSSSSSSSSSNSSSSSSSSNSTFELQNVILDYQFTPSGAYDASFNSVTPLASSGTIEVRRYGDAYGAFFIGTNDLELDPTILTSISSNTPKTTMVWCRPGANFLSTTEIVFSLGSAASNQAYLIQMLTQDWSGSVNGSSIQLTSNSIVPGWHHIVFASDGTNGYIYENGVFLISGALTFNTGTDDMWLGSNLIGSSNFTGGANDFKVLSAYADSSIVSSYYQQTSSYYANGDRVVFDYQFTLSGSQDNGIYSITPSTTGGTVSVVTTAGAPALKVTGSDYLSFDPPEFGAETVGLNSRTIGAWAYADATGSNQILFEFGTNASRETWGLRLNSTTWDGQKYLASLTGPAATAGVWTYLTYVYNYPNEYLYVNGVFQASAVETAIDTGYTQLQIGTNIDNTNGYSGYINDCKVWNYALTENQVSAYYQSTSAFYNP